MPFIAGPRVISASGGTISNIAGYTVHTFTTTGTFIPNGTGTVEVLVVGGGGGYGGPPGVVGEVGGGGGGSVIYQKFVPVLGNVNYTMTVGLGGGRGISGQASTCTYNGGNFVAPGGGFGGSLGGLGQSNPIGSGGGGSPTGGLGANIIGYGFSGGNGPSGRGAGGGGAGGLGQPDPLGRSGGIGVSYSISGVSTYYGGGGPGGVPLPLTSFPSMFGLGGDSNNFASANPGVIIIRYAS